MYYVQYYCIYFISTANLTRRLKSLALFNKYTFEMVVKRKMWKTVGAGVETNAVDVQHSCYTVDDQKGPVRLPIWWIS